MSFTKKQRLPNFEILRLVAMMTIVLLHCYAHGFFYLNTTTDSNLITFSLTSVTDACLYVFHQCVIIASGMGVDMLVMITGYFMITSRPRWDKVPVIWFQTMFYCVVIYAILVGAGVYDFSLKDFGAQFVPVYNGSYWFVTKYIGLIALAPFVNIMVRNLSRLQYRALLLVLLAMDFEIMCSFGYGKYFSGDCTLFHLATVYLLAGYIRIHPVDITAKKSFIAFCLSVAAIFLLTMLYEEYLNYRLNQPYGHVALTCALVSKNGLPIFTSFLFFVWISKLKVKRNWFTNALVRMAPYTFGVYLIHDNDYIRRLLWDSVVQHADVHSLWSVAYIPAAGATIFIACVGIDFLRKKLFDVLRVNERLTSLTTAAEQYVKKRL